MRHLLLSLLLTLSIGIMGCVPENVLDTAKATTELVELEKSYATTKLDILASLAALDSDTQDQVRTLLDRADSLAVGIKEAWVGKELTFAELDFLHEEGSWIYIQARTLVEENQDTLSPAIKLRLKRFDRKLQQISATYIRLRDNDSGKSEMYRNVYEGLITGIKLAALIGL